MKVSFIFYSKVMEYLYDKEDNSDKRITSLFVIKILGLIKNFRTSSQIIALDKDQNCHNPEYIYMTTNEYGIRKVRKILIEKPLYHVRLRCHIGVSSWYNFDIAVIRRPHRIILIDYNTAVRDFMIFTLKAIRHCENRHLFAEAIKRTNFTISQNSKYRLLGLLPFDCTSEENLRKSVDVEQVREGSWLSRDDSYSFIRGLVSEYRVTIIRADLAAPRITICEPSKIFCKLRNILGDYDVDTLYISNATDYIMREWWKDQLTQNTQWLMDEVTTIIDATQSGWKKMESGKEVCCIHQIGIANRSNFGNYDPIRPNGGIKHREFIPLSQEDLDLEDFPPELEAKPHEVLSSFFK